jgi:trafficking protein particle complex subunit 5
MLEVICFRERSSKREIKLIGILSFIHTSVWKTLFGKAADSLERSIEQEDEYMIIENDTLVNRFISVPKDFGNLNCAAFAAGIVHGILDCADFVCSRSHSIRFARLAFTDSLLSFYISLFLLLAS